MVFQVEKSDRFEITGGTFEYMSRLSLKILKFSIVSILILAIGTLPAAVVGVLLSPIASGLYLILVVLLGSRLAIVFLKYDIRIQGVSINGVRSSATGGPRWRMLGLLSAGGLNLLITTSIVVGALVATVAPPFVFIIASFSVLVSNELARKQFDISISIIGVRATRYLLEKTTSQSIRERRELSKLSTAAEWVASSLTVYGQVGRPTF